MSSMYSLLKKISILFMVPIFTSNVFSQEFKLVWQEDFNQLDENIWNIEVNGDGGGNDELQYYRAENVLIENYNGKNCLVLSAKKENFKGRLATSGRINTHEKLTFQYGMLEIRLKLPTTANGLWPAFWMLGGDFNTVQWPRCGEIDILETGHYLGIEQGTQNKHMNAALHWGEYHHDDVKFSNAPYVLNDDFHLITMIWDENSISMYLDLDKYPQSAPYFTQDISGKNEKNHRRFYFHKPYSLLLNLAVGGKYTGITGNENIDKISSLNADGTPVKMYIDYIRLYQKGQPNDKFLKSILKKIK